MVNGAGLAMATMDLLGFSMPFSTSEQPLPQEVP